MNRMTIAAGAALLLALAGGLAAQAQPLREPVPPYPYYMVLPIPPGEMLYYCVYQNRVYSLGSGVCIGHTPFVCVSSQGPATGSRAYWTSKEDSIFGRPTCG
jgi:hypothetical protein